MQYLTNTDKNEDDEFKTYVAAMRSGQNVRYLNCPMPPNHSDEFTENYYYRTYHSGKFNNFACIVGMEDEFDYSKFWAEWRKLEN